MVDREKVIRGLEACNRQSYNGSDCQNCPYYDDEDTAELPFGICNIQDMFDDALALLKEQEARVVTTADFEDNPNLDDGYHLNVWEEYKDGARCGWNTINVNDVRAFTDLRRYWTSRPTPEQMRDTPWKGEKNA